MFRQVWSFEQRKLFAAETECKPDPLEGLQAIVCILRELQLQIGENTV